MPLIPQERPDIRFLFRGLCDFVANAAGKSTLPVLKAIDPDDDPEAFVAFVCFVS